MKHYRAYECDNRDSAEMYNYMEARIEALKRRIVQLEEENQNLRSQDVQRQTGRRLVLQACARA